MGMTTQEIKGMIPALEKEISGHEKAIENWEEQLESVTDTSDPDQTRFLRQSISESKRAIRIAGEQLEMLKGNVSTSRGRAQKRDK